MSALRLERFTDAISVSEQLHDLYLRYLDSALPLRDERLMKERRSLFSRAGVIYQPPLFEFLPRYREVGSLSEISTSAGLLSEFADFAACGLFPANRQLYAHQRQSLLDASVGGMNLVVTSGTGWVQSQIA